MWKRPKEVNSTTTHIKTACGTLNYIKGYEGKRLIEVRAIIGKSGVCPNILLDAFWKTMSCYLQSPETRVKICKKIKKQLEGVDCGSHFKVNEKEYKSCIDYIAQDILKEIR